MPRHTILNPKTGRRVLKTGALGKRIAEKQRKRDQANKNKKSKKAPRCSNSKCISKNVVKQSGKTRLTGGPLFKGVKNGGCRISASTYFNDICGGKIGRCRPMWILQPSGQTVLKRIKIIQGAHGREPRWIPC